DAFGCGREIGCYGAYRRPRMPLGDADDFSGRARLGYRQIVFAKSLEMKLYGLADELLDLSLGRACGYHAGQVRDIGCPAGGRLLVNHYIVHGFNSACFRTPFRVPGGRSSFGWPGNVTRPVFAVVVQSGFFRRRRHPERSRFSGGAKDLPLNWPGASAKLHHYRLCRMLVLTMASFGSLQHPAILLQHSDLHRGPSYLLSNQISPTDAALPMLHRHIPIGILRPEIFSPGTNQAVIVQLLDHVRRPAADSRNGKYRREQV